MQVVNDLHDASAASLLGMPDGSAGLRDGLVAFKDGGSIARGGA
jgi:hypothetical protein